MAGIEGGPGPLALFAAGPLGQPRQCPERFAVHDRGRRALAAVTLQERDAALQVAHSRGESVVRVLFR